MTKVAKAGYALAIVCAFALWPLATSAETKDDPRRRLKQLEQDIARDREQSEKMKKRATDLAAEIETVRARAVAAASKAQESERTLARLEAEAAALGRAEAMIVARLRARHADVGSAVMALQRLALYPPEAMFAHPAPPSDMVRGAGAGNAGRNESRGAPSRPVRGRGARTERIDGASRS